MYLSTKEVMQLFGWKSRAMVSQTASREGWRKVQGIRPRMYLASDVKDYQISREHTRLTYSGICSHLIRHINGHSDKCPVCKNGS